MKFWKMYVYYHISAIYVDLDDAIDVDSDRNTGQPIVMNGAPNC